MIPTMYCSIKNTKDMETLKEKTYKHEGYKYAVRLSYEYMWGTNTTDIIYGVYMYDSTRWIKTHTTKDLGSARLYFDSQCVVLERELESMGWRPKH